MPGITMHVSIRLEIGGSIGLHGNGKSQRG